MITIQSPSEGHAVVLPRGKLSTSPEVRPQSGLLRKLAARRFPGWTLGVLAKSLLLFLSVPTTFAVDAIPIPVSGHVRFNNLDPGFPAIFGLRAIAVSANSPSSLRSASSDYLLTTGPISSDYRLVVDAQDAPGAGIDYQFSYVLYGVGTSGSSLRARYALTGPHVNVVPGPGISGVNAGECAGIVHVRFRDASGAPMAVAGGTLAGSQGELDLRPGSTEDDLVVHVDTNFRLTATITTGIGDSSLRFVLATNVTAVCDRVVAVDFVVPSATRLGTIRGEIDMVGETEATWGDLGDTERYPVYTFMEAVGPTGNRRTYTLPTRAVAGGPVESSGSYTLPNLLLGAVSDPPTPYTLQGSIGLQRFRQFESFVTPKLGLGRNPAPTVGPGSTLDVGHTFVMTPGFVDGTITFSGPRESSSGTYRSPLRGIFLNEDVAAGRPPSRFATLGRAVIASGVDRPAAGATYTAAGGQAAASFDGSFEALSGQWRGEYQLVLAGLNGESSVWRPDSLGVRLNAGSPTDPANYVSQDMSLIDHRISEEVIVPGEHIRIDRQYRFGQVCLRFRSTGEPFWNPRLWLYSSGTGAGYEVTSIVAYGTPNSSDAAADHGTMVLYLPEGTYHLVPFISTANRLDYLQLEPFDLDVRALQQQCVTPCLRVDFDLPQCTTVPQLNLKGLVHTFCDNQVKRVTYRVDDGPEVELCSACGANPSLSFGASLPGGDCSEHDITVTAIDSNGEVASNTQHVRLDSQPPSITCPKDVVLECVSAAGTRVEYPTPTVADNCPGPVTVVCTPASGSLFALGETIVRCVATDACGNSAECKFTVTIVGQCTGCGLTCPPDINVPCTGPEGAVVNYAEPQLSGDCAKGSKVVCDPPSGFRFPVGITVVRCKAIGLKGELVTECKFIVNVRGDCAGCELTCPPDISIDCNGPEGAVVNYPEPKLSANCSKGTKSVCDPVSGSRFPVGVSIVRCKVVGPAGELITECKFTVTVTGNCNSCLLFCPNNMEVECTSPNGVIVNYPTPALTGNCPKGTVIRCDPPSGAFFPVGTTQVRCQAISPEGNAITDCKFFIAVRCGSTGTCKLVCPPDLKIECTGPEGAKVTYAAPAFTGDCGPGTTVVCKPPSGSQFPLGPTIVVCQAIASTGKVVAECKFTVVVNSQLSIEPAILVRWSCGTLQSAPDSSGPWTNVPGATSPYYASSREAMRYYRIH